MIDPRKPTLARELATLYLGWRKTFWPITKFILLAPWTFLWTMYCCIVHGAAGLHNEDEGCKLCGKYAYSGEGDYFSVWILSAICVVLFWFFVPILLLAALRGKIV